MIAGLLLPERYRLLEVLGEGGMGTVYRAYDQALGRVVALKTLHSGLGEKGRRRFQREAQALALLRHPGLPEVYEVGEGPRPYLACELVEGEALDACSPPEDPQGVLLEVAEALEAVHRAGLVHRDVKPSNMMWAPGRRARLIDLGLALDPRWTRLTHDRHAVGTIAYMAPEVAAGQEATPASDWWGWGMSLWNLLEGRGSLPRRDFLCLLQGVRPEIRFERVDPASKVARLIRACLRWEPRERPAGLAEIRRLLRASPSATCRLPPELLDLSLEPGGCLRGGLRRPRPPREGLRLPRPPRAWLGLAVMGWGALTLSAAQWMGGGAGGPRRISSPAPPAPAPRVLRVLGREVESLPGRRGLPEGLEVATPDCERLVAPGEGPAAAEPRTVVPWVLEHHCGSGEPAEPAVWARELEAPGWVSGLEVVVATLGLGKGELLRLDLRAAAGGPPLARAELVGVLPGVELGDDGFLDSFVHLGGGRSRRYRLRLELPPSAPERLRLELRAGREGPGAAELVVLGVALPPGPVHWRPWRSRDPARETGPDPERRPGPRAATAPPGSRPAG